MSQRLWVDPDLCMSSGRCVADLPELFRFDDEEIAEVVPDADLPTDSAVLVAAVRNCPAGAIHLQTDGVEVEA